MSIFESSKKISSSLASTFSDLIDIMDIAMWHLDLDYRIIGYNKKAKEIYGKLTFGDYCYSTAAKLNSVCDNCPAKMVYNGQESGRSEHKRINAAGELIYIDHIATPIRDENGHLTGSLVLIIDITHHKKQESELLEHRSNLEQMVMLRTKELEESQARYRTLYEETSRSEKLYQSLLNSSADAIVIYNLVGEVQYLSPSFSELFGWQLDEVKGKVIPFVPQSEKESTLIEIRRVLNTNEPARNFPTKRFTKDGRLLDIYISASKYEDKDGNPVGLLVILKDATETKAMERQLYRAQKIEALATLSGGIAHDFNNLLMGIQGNASLLLIDHDNRDKYFERLKNIEKYVKRGESLTKQMLGLSKGGKYQVKPTNINNLITDCSSMFGEAKKDITLSLDLSNDIWTVEVDRGQMEQVLLNLFVNAGQAMQFGGELSIGTQNIKLDQHAVEPYQLVPGKYIQITVSDTGIGIDDSIKDRIFDPFFTTKEKERGTGLGLASAYGIVNNHAGFIRVESTVGQGTTFRIFLPASIKKIEPKKTVETALLRGKETILIVDDEKMITDIGKQLLENLGYQVITADSGHEALEIYKKENHRIDMVILDMIMPGLNGRDTFEQLKAINPQIKTLLSSGFSLDGQAASILERGCNGFLQKPFDIKGLSRKVREILD